MARPVKPPFYVRALRLKYAKPGPMMSFALLEGAIMLCVLLTLAELIVWWGVFAVPVAIAGVVKLNDMITGLISPTNGVHTHDSMTKRASRKQAAKDALAALAEAEAGPPETLMEGEQGTVVGMARVPLNTVGRVVRDEQPPAEAGPETEDDSEPVRRPAPYPVGPEAPARPPNAAKVVGRAKPGNVVPVSPAPAEAPPARDSAPAVEEPEEEQPAVGVAQVPLRTAEPLDLPPVAPLPQPLQTVPVRGIAPVRVLTPEVPPKEPEAGDEPQAAGDGTRVVGRATVVGLPHVMPLATGALWPDSPGPEDGGDAPSSAAMGAVNGYGHADAVLAGGLGMELPVDTDRDEQAELAERRGRANQGRYAT